MLGGKSSSEETGPIFSKISKGPKYLDASLKQFPKFKVLFYDFTFKNTWSLAETVYQSYFDLHNFYVYPVLFSNSV